MYGEERVAPTIADLNEEPVNRRAREALDEAGEPSDSSYLYAAQLALWGIERAGLEADVAVVETVRAMLSWRPVRIMNFFCGGVEGIFSMVGWEEAATARELAEVILREIDARTFGHFRCYLSGE